jgi:hypothetical protein
MAGRSKTLPVPYFAQPTGVTCQSTVLKMFASYLEGSVLFQSTGAGDRAVLDIWKDVNQDPMRPSKVQNAHANMKWWLEQHFPRLKFVYEQVTRQDQALEKIVGFIDQGFPVLVAVSHINVAGHIILVVGYENFVPNSSSADFKLIVHDPYGQFDPSLKSKLFGNRRWEGGASLVGGGELAPGKGTKLSIDAVDRHRPGDTYFGTYYLLSATR